MNLVQIVCVVIGFTVSVNAFVRQLDAVIQWNVINEDIATLKGKEFPQSSENLVDEIITSVPNIEDHYFNSTESIYSWCKSSIPILER